MPTPKQVLAAWEKARAGYHYPPLANPRVVRKYGGGASYDFRSRQTLIGGDYADDLSAKSGKPVDECLEGISSHEIGHYMTFPRTLGRAILAAKMIDDFFAPTDKTDTRGLDLETREFIFQTFADMASDTASVLEEQRTEAILGVREAMQTRGYDDDLNRNVRGVMLGYLHHQAGREHGLDEELQPYFERMREIDFTEERVKKGEIPESENLRQGIWTFGNIIAEMIKKYAKPGQTRLGGDGHSDSNIRKLLGKATPGEMREALREIAQKITRKEYEKVKEWLENKGKDLKGTVPSSGQSFGIGTSEGELPVDREVVEYYLDLSREHPLVVTKRLLDTRSTIRAWSEVERWRVGSDPLLALPHTSGGLFLPGITRSVRVTERPIKSRDYKVPHLLVVIDSSGSMPKPKEAKSYGVVGGYCAARSYHLHGSSVGVINFSGSSFYLPYTRELMDALGGISAYQGGGTTVDMEMLRKMLGPEMAELYRNMPERNMGGLPREAIKKEVALSMPQFQEAFATESLDVLMFTDGGISNLGDVLDFFAERAELNRATIVLVHRFDQADLESYDERINVVPVEDEKDIPGICIKATQRHLNLMAQVGQHAT